jgi:tetratricopeptide (TPR) repeat protein
LENAQGLADGLSSQAELEAWANALTAYDAEDFQKALEFFEVRILMSVIQKLGADYHRFVFTP